MQPKYKYYEHIPGIIGIKTDISGFRWGFGKCDDPVGEQEFENCKIKVYIESKKDSKVFEGIKTSRFTEIFRHFRVDPKSNEVIFEKKVANIVALRFLLSISDNSVSVVVGKSYLKYVKAKMMYIHSIAYILFDIVSILLLKNGMTTLYCSAACLPNGKNVVFIAPPNTGKSLTVLKLQNDINSAIIAEDMAVTDGDLIWGAPYTNLYRDYNDKTLKKPVDGYEKHSGEKIDAVIILQKSENESEDSVIDFREKVLLINRYSLGYYYSPVVRTLDYFGNAVSIKEGEKTEELLINKILSNSKTFLVKKSNPMDFSSAVCSLLCE